MKTKWNRDRLEDIFEVKPGDFVTIAFEVGTGQTLSIWARETDGDNFDLLLLREEDVTDDEYWEEFSLLEMEKKGYYKETYTFKEEGSMCLVLSNTRGRNLEREVHLKLTLMESGNEDTEIITPEDEIVPSTDTIESKEKWKNSIFLSIIIAVPANLISSLYFQITLTQSPLTFLLLNIVAILVSILLIFEVYPRIEESRSTETKSDTVTGQVKWTRFGPISFPSKTKLAVDRTRLVNFKLEFEVEVTERTVDVNIYVKSETQAIAFMLENPVQKFSWRRLRNETHGISLDNAIKDRLVPGEKGNFVFHGLLRPTFMIWEKMNYTIYYRITLLTPNRKYAMDTGLKRIVIPIERNQE